MRNDLKVILRSLVFGLCPACCLSGMLPAGSWKRFAEKRGLQWLSDEGAADGRVLHHLREEKQEYEKNRIVEKEWSSLCI